MSWYSCDRSLLVTALQKHVHQFVKDVRLNEAESFHANQFLTAMGQLCSDKRQEFILLSDTIGVSPYSSISASLLVPSSPPFFGPFYREDSPELPAGGNVPKAKKEALPVRLDTARDADAVKLGAIFCWRSANKSIRFAHVLM